MRYLLAIITVAGLWLAMGTASAATTNVTPVVVNPAVGFDTWMRPGDRLAMPTTTGGFTAVLDPGTQTANAVFSYPVIVGSDTLAVLGLPQHFTAKITFNASTTAAGSINVPAGTAPTSPVDGDIWETTAGLFLRVNGSTIGPVGAGGGAGVITVNTRNGVVVLTGTDIPSFVASGASHAPGAVPDPGASAGTTKFLREDATWAIPAAVSGVSSVNTRTGAVTLVGTDIPAFVASGASHAPGAVPDPGVTGGTTKFLREDATFAVPSGSLPAGLTAPSPILPPDVLLTLNSNTTAASPEARAFYPQSVYFLPVAKRAQLQSALDQYGAVRLETGDYTAGQAFGYTITLRTGYRLYGTGVLTCKIPALSIAAGSTAIVVSGIGSFGSPETVTFQAGATISNCVFRHVSYCFAFQGSGASVDSCLWYNTDNSAYNFDCSAGGFFTNNRIIGSLSQGNTPEIQILGNPAIPCIGNQIGEHQSLQQVQSSTPAINLTNAADVSIWGGGFERVNGTTQYGISLASTVTAGRIFSQFGAANAGNMINVATPKFSQIYQSFGLSGGAIMDAFASTSATSVSLYNVNQSAFTDAASSPNRFSAFDNSTLATNLNGSAVSGALSGPAAAAFASIMYPARTEAEWPLPTWDLPPANPLGNQWAGLISTLPDASSYIQGLIDANGIAILGPGVYKIVTPLKLSDGHGIIGAGMHKTVLVAANQSTDIITQNIAVTGDAQRICLTDVTLQGGMNGIHHISFTGGGRYQFTNMVISHVCFRDMANCGMYLDQIYAWDTNALDNCDFVNCAYAGIGTFSVPGAPNDNTGYCDKMLIYHSRFLNCGWAAHYVTANRASGGMDYISCLFADQVTGVVTGQYLNQMQFTNSLFRNNGGAPTMEVTGGQLLLLHCNFDAGRQDTTMVDGSEVYMADCTFTRGTANNPEVFGTDFPNGLKFLVNNNYVDIPTGNARMNNIQSVNCNYGAGDNPSLNVGWAFRVGGTQTTAISTTSNPVPQMLRGANLPTIMERLQSIDGQGINTPFTPQNIVAATGGGPFIATGSTTSRTPADRAADRWNVKDFGCIDDGTTTGGGTDNAAALTSAVTAAHNQYVATGQRVELWLGKGTYAIGSSVSWQSGVALYGPGCLVTKNASTYTGAVHAIIKGQSLTDIAFIDVVAYGVGPDQTIAGPCSSVSSLGGRDSFLDLDQCTNELVSRCYLYRFMDTIVTSRPTPTYRITNNYINSLSSKTLASLDDGSFVPYVFTTSPGSGIDLEGTRTGLNLGPTDYGVVADNVIICVGLDIAINCASQSGYPVRVQVTGNTVAGTNSGIQSYTSGVATPDPGTLTTTDKGTNIAGNTVYLTYQQGIYIRGVEGVACTSNTVSRCALIGTYTGASAGGICQRGTTNSTYPISPVHHDLPILISSNHVIDCGNPTTGVIDSGIRADCLHCQVEDNEIFRSIDRFGANINVANSNGIQSLDTGTNAAPLSTVVRNNHIRGFNTGIVAAYNGGRQLTGIFSYLIDGNVIAEVVNGIQVNTLSSGYYIQGNIITECTGIGIYVKNAPYSKIERNTIYANTTGIDIASGNLASDYYSLGGRMGPTLRCDNNVIWNAATPILINETATGDASVVSRCITSVGTMVNGNPSYNAAAQTFTFTATPTATDYHIWHLGDQAFVRTPTSAPVPWTCTTAGAFGAAIATTAATTATSTTVTFSGLTVVVPDDYITIAGVTGTKHVISINPATNTCVVDVACNASVSGAAITRPAPVFSNLTAVPNGGTGLATATAHGVLVGQGTNAMTVTAAGTTGQVLTGVTGSDPVWAAGGGGSVPTGTGFTHITGGTQDSAARAVNVGTSDITGTQAIGNGGTGVSSATNHGVLLGQGTSALVATAVGTTGQVLTGVTGSDPVWTTLGASGVSSVNTRTGAVTLVGTDIPAFIASGASHAPGAVPDPGATPGTTKFLREDGTFQIPSGAGGGFPASTTAYIVQDATDNTKQQLWNLASASTGTNLTLKGQQSTSQTIAFPNVTAPDTVATLGVADLFTAPAQTAVAPPSSWSFTGGAHTVLTSGSIGAAEFLVDLGQVKQWNGGSGVTSYAAMNIKPPTLAATSTTTFSSPATLNIAGAPIAGANSTVSAGVALNINGGGASISGQLKLTASSTNILALQASASSGLAQHLTFTGSSVTGQTAGGNQTQVAFNYGQTEQHATGAIAVNDTILVSAPTLTAVGASTITDASAFSVTGAPTISTNLTATNQPSAIWAKSGQIRAGGNFMGDPGAAPAILQDGQFWQDSTQQTLSTRSKGLTTPLEGTIFTATSTGTCTATVAETTIVGSGIGTKTLSANYLVPGKTIRILIKGIVSNNPGDSLDIKVKAGSTVILDTTPVVVAGTLTNTYFQVTATITCRTTGASGSVMASGNLGYMNGSTGQGVSMVNTSTVALDTTIAEPLDVTATWNSTSASNSIGGQIVTYDAVN